jgi:hypothetical protein
MSNINYYKLIGIDINDENINNIELIINLCNKKLLSYKYLPFLNSNQQLEFKELQKAKYIFMNKELKNKYDNIIFKKHIKQNTHTNTNTFEAYQDSNLDNLFSLNTNSSHSSHFSNSTNNNTNLDNSNSKKKEKINNNLVGDRIFSMVGIINNPQPNTEIDRNFFNES